MDATGKIIMAAILLFVGIGLLSSITTSTADVTTTFVGNQSTNLSIYFEDGLGNYPQGGSINETLANFTVSPFGGTDADCPITNVLVENETGVIATLGTDYEVDAPTGRIGFLNVTTFNETYLGTNFTNISYIYCKEGYMRLGWGKTVLNTIPGFFALALMLVAVAIFYNVYQDYRKKQ